MLSRPLTPSDDDIDTPLPSHFNDEYMAHSPPNTDAHTTPAPTSISPFLQMIRLRRSLSRIHRTFYTNMATRLLSLEQKEAIRRDLLNELNEWRASNDRLLRVAPKSDCEGVLSAFTDRSWYEALYHNAVLLLYRPSTAFPHQSLESSTRNDDILRTMWNSSRATIYNYREVLRARKLNYSWICLYSIFIAGLSNVYSVGRCAQRRVTDRASFLPSVIDVIDDVRECSNILTAICERWDDARSSCEIFSRLSNGAIKELLKAQALPSSSLNTVPITAGVGNSTVPTSNLAYEAPAMDWSSSDNVLQDLSHPSAEQRPRQDQHQYDNIQEFQQLFQDVQTNSYEYGFNGSNEVFFGFDKDWFDQAC